MTKKQSADDGSDDDSSKPKNSPKRGYKLENKGSSDKGMSFAKFLFTSAFYLSTSAFLISQMFLPKGPDFTHDISNFLVDTFYRESFSSNPISESLNLEGMLAQSANNLVRISSEGGIGNGIFADDQTIYTAYHVISDSYKNKKPIYIQNQTFFSENEVMKISFDETKEEAGAVPAFIDANKDLDIAKIVLSRPIENINKIPIERGHGHFYTDENIKLIGYRDKELYNVDGYPIMNHYESGRSVFCVTDINAGPGNSGSPVFNRYGELVGIVSMAILKNKPEYTKYDYGKMIFTNINNID